MYTATAQRPTAFGISEFGAQVSPRVAPTAPRLKITRRGRLVLSALVAAPLVIGAVVVGVNAGGDLEPRRSRCDARRNLGAEFGDAEGRSTTKPSPRARPCGTSPSRSPLLLTRAT
jgi:hypothetical protein